MWVKTISLPNQKVFNSTRHLQTTYWMYLKQWLKTAFDWEENIVEKGENAGDQHFLLYPQYFLPYYREKTAF